MLKLKSSLTEEGGIAKPPVMLSKIIGKKQFPPKLQAAG
jgi:hypothetical protein